jgi:hypothetical protein
MYLELYENMLWFHTDVFKWTKQIKQEYIKDLDTLQTLVQTPLVALVEEDNEKLAKFGKTIGWNKIDILITNEKRYDVYARRI